MHLTRFSEQEQQHSSTKVIFQWNIKQIRHYKTNIKTQKKDTHYKQWIKTQVRENQLISYSAIHPCRLLRGIMNSIVYTAKGTPTMYILINTAEMWKESQKKGSKCMSIWIEV